MDLVLSWESVRTCVLFDAVSVPHSPAPPDELWPHWPKLVPSAPSELKQLAWASNAAMRILITTDYSVQKSHAQTISFMAVREIPRLIL